MPQPAQPARARAWPEQLRRLAAMAALAAVYYGAARLGLLLAFADSNASPVWPPSGIALAALLLFGYRLWPGIALGACAANFAVFAANQVAGGPASAAVSLLIAGGNTLEALSGAWLLTRFAGAVQPLAHLQNIYKFAIVAMLMSALSAAIGTSALLASGIAPAGAQWTIASTWWLGDVSGVLVVSPLLLAWCARPVACRNARQGCEIGLSLLLLSALSILIFGQRFAPNSELRWLAYLFIPCIGWSAFRHGLRGASLACLLVAAGAVWGTTRGFGPFAVGALNDSLVALESFIALCSLIGLVLCADMSELRRLGRSAQPGRHIAAHWATLLVGVGLTVLVWNLVASSTERRAHERFDLLVATIGQRIVERIDTSAQALRSAQAVFTVLPAVDRAAWRRFVAGMDIVGHLPGLQAIGYAQWLAPAGRDSFEQAARAEGFARFEIRPAGQRAAYVPVTFTEPFSGTNLRAFGYDMYSEPVRRAALELARDSGRPALSGKVHLLQDKAADMPAGVLMYLPVYRNGAAVQSVAQRRAALQGYVYSPFRMSELMAGVLAPGAPEVRLDLFDGTATHAQSQLFAGAQPSARERQRYPNPFTAQAVLDVGDRHWTIRVTSLALFEESIDRQKAQIVLIAGTVISLLFFGVVRALTARRAYAVALAGEMTAALEQSEKKFESLVESASEFAIIATDPHGVIRVFSVGAERMLGYRAQQMAGRQTPLVLHLEQEVAQRGAELSAELGYPVQGFAVFVACVLRGGAESREWTYVRQDGSTLPVTLVVTAIRDADGRVTGFLGVANDITRQRQLQSSLVAARDQAEAASRAKSDFVANMSHEIRTPMNAVLGMAALLGGTALSEQQRKYLDMIRQSGQSLLSILNDILDFSKVEAGRMECLPAPFELGTVLKAVAAIMTVNGGARELELAIGVAPDVPPALVGDALRLQQVLVNLVGNAIKFTERGEVSLRVELAERRGAALRLRFCVRDTGIGMDAEQQSRLFAAFSQADASMTRRFGGTGLGLAICRRLVDLMEGSIAVHSVPGQGSEFCVTLPLQAAGPEPAPAAAAPGGLRLLVLDGQQTSRDCLCQTIRGLHWQADGAASNEQALGLIRAGASYDVVLAGWPLAPADGAALRAMLAAPLVLTVSPFGAGPLMQTGAQQGDAILVKPVTAAALADAVRDVLAPRAGQAEEQPSVLAPQRRLDGTHLLLVEDNQLNQVVARGLLEQAGARVDVVENGQQAVDLLRGAAPCYDLILMDAQMPVMDGFTATGLIRKELGLSLPVLAMTAGVMAFERERCTASGMDDFIAKPVDGEQMLAVIARHLPARRAGDGGVFEPAALLEYSMDDPAGRRALLDLIGSVTGQGPAQLQQSRQAWEAGRSDEAARILHMLRGAIGALGASRFTAAAQETETAVRAGRSEGVAALFEAARHALQATVAAADRWRATQAGSADSLAPAPDSDRLAYLKRMLAEKDLAACSAYAELRGLLAGQLAQQELAALDSAIDRLQFEDALQRLTRLCPG